MRLLSFSVDGRESWGAVVGEEVVELGQELPQYQGIADFIGSNAFVHPTNSSRTRSLGRPRCWFRT